MLATATPSLVEAIAADFQRNGSRPDGLDLSTENVALAVHDYERVRQANRKAFLLARGDVTAREVALSEELNALSSPFDKSSLLRRLIEGKRPLREPAPRAMSYPAYGFVEEDKAFRVSIGCFGAADEIVIEQCRYRVTARNPAARALARILRSEADFESAAFLAAVKDVPVWTVRFGNWPAWELTVGVIDAGAGRRDSVERRGNSPVDWADACWGGWGPIVETGKTTATLNSLARAQAALASIPMLRERKERGEQLSLTDQATLGFEAHLERDVAIGLDDPRNLDWISFQQKSWVLRRSADWSTCPPFDMYLDHSV